MTTLGQIEFVPQKGPQTKFVKCSTDIAFYGGAAGGGKSYALLLDAARDVKNKDYGAVIFRRTTKQVTSEGGLWDTASGIYSLIGAKPNQTALTFTFPPGGRVGFAHMEHEKNRFDWQGAQIAYIGFDELTHFTWAQFSYMLSRNRSTSGVDTRIRATLNPDPDHFARKWVDWYLDSEGYAIPDRSGVVRWLIVVDDTAVFADTKRELINQYPNSLPLSFTFIASSIEDNQILLKLDPKYLANLDALPRVERERLKKGNWNIRPSAGSYFKRSEFEIVDVLPAGKDKKTVRAWDLAGSDKKKESDDPDWTAGVKMSVIDKVYYVEHVERFQIDASKVMGSIKNVATSDSTRIPVLIPQDPGQAGKTQVRSYVQEFAGYIIKTNPVSGSKTVRATPFSSQVQGGNVKILRGSWNDAYLSELESFDGSGSGHDDQVDASSDAFNELALGVTTTGIIEYYRQEADKLKDERKTA